MIKNIAVVLTVMMCAAAATPCYCQDEAEGRELMTVEGYVTTVDDRGSQIKIRGIKNTGFSIDKNATITAEDASDIKLSDINKGDYVAIEYYDEPSGSSVVTSIAVQYKAGEGW
ncbi:MAG: hypothetical protein WC592_07750 [Candidatus Omnitrophota bacterium]|nr:hypothetical protein [Candidatus Omnitrophota bacterium]